MIGSAGRAMICDFGGARIEQASRTLGLPTASTKGTYSYCSPEKLVAMEYENIEPTAVITMQKQADIWAFGMTIFVKFSYNKLLTLVLIYTLLRP